MLGLPASNGNFCKQLVFLTILRQIFLFTEQFECEYHYEPEIVEIDY